MLDTAAVLNPPPNGNDVPLFAALDTPMPVLAGTMAPTRLAMTDLPRLSRNGTP